METRDGASARVAREMRTRGWSERRVAAEATERGVAISNTTIGRYAQSGEVTPKIRRAIAAAFDWSTSWPEDPPPLPDNEVAIDVLDHVLDLERRMASMEHTRDKAMPEVTKNSRLLAELTERVDQLRDQLRDVQRAIGPTQPSIELPPGLAP